MGVPKPTISASSRAATPADSPTATFATSLTATSHAATSPSAVRASPALIASSVSSTFSGGP